MTQHATQTPAPTTSPRMSRPPSSRTVCRQAPACARRRWPGLPGQPHQDPRRAADAVQGQADQYRAGQGRLRQQAQRRRGARGLCRAPHPGNRAGARVHGPRPADFRRIRPTWPRSARRWRVATRRRATACWATSTCCSPRSSATRCSPTCCASCWRAASSPRCPEHARRRLFLARAPCLHPGAQGGDADAASALMDEHLRHAGRPGFQAGAQGDADLVTALLR